MSSPNYEKGNYSPQGIIAGIANKVFGTCGSPDATHGCAPSSAGSVGYTGVYGGVFGVFGFQPK